VLVQEQAVELALEVVLEEEQVQEVVQEVFKKDLKFFYSTLVFGILKIVIIVRVVVYSMSLV